MRKEYPSRREKVPDAFLSQNAVAERYVLVPFPVNCQRAHQSVAPRLTNHSPSADRKRVPTYGRRFAHGQLQLIATRACRRESGGSVSRGESVPGPPFETAAREHGLSRAEKKVYKDSRK